MAGIYDELLAGFGALGVAVQNYQAVELFLKSVVPASQSSRYAIQAAALGAGGICSGMVNFKMNMDLLDDFFARWRFQDYDTYKQAGYFNYKKASLFEQVKYFGGSCIVVVTGILFGLMAFTFAMGSPLAMLSFALGLFVTAITMIQEVEAWLSAFDAETATGLPQSFGEWCGYIIAVGNVFAFSLMFTLSLAQTLILLQVAALPALLIGAVVSFTFGAFTEYNFYAPYLTKLCGEFGEKWKTMMKQPYALLGLVCISTNAFVNAALTYATLELLTALLLSTTLALPPVAAITALSAVLTFFAGSASFLLGMNFWIGKENAPTTQTNVDPIKPPTSLFGIFGTAAAHNITSDDASREQWDMNNGCTVS